MPDGKVLPNPPSYAEFTRYAESCVKPEDSLLRHCGKVTEGMPPKPIFADDLDVGERARVRDICRAAGVRERPLLDDCMLDVSMFGDNSAADVFRSAPQPIKEIRPTFP
jgi:hypothetical protein